MLIRSPVLAVTAATLWSLRPALAAALLQRQSSRSLSRSLWSITRTAERRSESAALRQFSPSTSSHHRRHACLTLRASSSSSSKGRTSLTRAEQEEVHLSMSRGVSRLSLLHTLLSRHGAPGSRGCTEGGGDLVPLVLFQTPSSSDSSSTPELVSSLVTSGDDNSKDQNFSQLHPHLFPIAQSTQTGNLICAYRSPYRELDSSKGGGGNPAAMPWPLVETRLRAPGMQLLALNSEHLMRRIVCQCDEEQTESPSSSAESSISLYNEGLGTGQLPMDPSLDVAYETGSVAKLGYGVDKYVLLRVGPFPDLYQTMALQHAGRGDEPSSLIAAEAANSRLSGFGSNFLFYSQLLSQFPNRQEESRDAARMCLRLPLSTVGMDVDDFCQVAVQGQMAAESDSPSVALAKMRELYGKMREVEKEDDSSSTSAQRTPEQFALDDADHLLNMAVLTGLGSGDDYEIDWNSVRAELADKFASVGRDDMVAFVRYFLVSDDHAGA